MVVVSYSGKEINAKLVYYGCGLSGKTTNLESIYEAVPETSRGKMVSMKTQSDRTLFFDLLPLDLGEIMGFKTRFLLYTVPGQVFYNATRKLVLKGADAIVFVADSEVGKMEENKESLANLRTNLAEYGLSLDNIPWVLQYNKRDLPNVYSIDELNTELNPGGKIPTFEAVAKDGKGVFEIFRGISHLLMEKVTRDLRRTSGSTASPAARTAAAEEAPGAPSAAKPQPAPAAPHPALLEREGSPTHAVREPARGMDYGREIELPGASSAPTRAPGAASAAPAPATSRLTAAPPVRTPPPPASLGPPRAEPGTAPAADPYPRRPGSAPPAETGARRPFPPGPSRSDTGLSPGPGARTPPPSTGPGLAPNPAAAGREASASSEELIVPIQIGTNGTHEIVLRIVLKLDG